MKLGGRWLAAFLLVIMAVILTGTGASISMTGGSPVIINGADSVQGVSTPSGTSITATGSIQAAVNAATPSATISLLPKTYYEIVWVPVSVDIIGAGTDSTIVDGQQKGSVFTVPSGVTATLSSMTIQNGEALFGGGINNAGTLIVKYGKITGNDAIESDDYVGRSGLGGGIYNTGTATITDSTISGNAAADGGGIANGGYYKTGTVTITDSTISGNTATWGGGIYNYNGILTVIDGTIFGNAASGGGGIFNYGTVTVRDSTIYGNTAEFAGGGISNYDYSTATVVNSAISGNTATWGGGIENDYYAMLIVEGSTITENKAITTIIELGDSHGGGIYNDGGSTATVTDCTISGNIADYGGGIYNPDSGTASVTRSLISQNIAVINGGGIYNLGTLNPVPFPTRQVFDNHIGSLIGPTNNISP